MSLDSAATTSVEPRGTDLERGMPRWLLKLVQFDSDGSRFQLGLIEQSWSFKVMGRDRPPAAPRARRAAATYMYLGVHSRTYSEYLGRLGTRFQVPRYRSGK
eukprot:SAG31_NODE_11009_length_1074_cov_1.272821_1_plen_102_part_00